MDDLSPRAQLFKEVIDSETKKIEKIISLRRTIQHMIGQIELARRTIPSDPGMADLLLSECVGDKRFEYN